MDKGASDVDLREAARLARECVVLGQAVTLARWIGSNRRPVTPGKVLRKADVSAAGAALGVNVPTRLRTMADVRALHWPWCVAVAAGLLQIDDGSATGGPALECWPLANADLLAGWLSGLRAVCAAESRSQEEDSVRLMVMALLMILSKDSVPRRGGLHEPTSHALDGLCDRYGKPHWEISSTTYKYFEFGTGMPTSDLMALLTEFGAVVGDPGKPVITPLGHWAARHLGAGLPGPANPELPVNEMIAQAARFSDEKQQDHVAWGWLAGRQPAEAAREILTAAEAMSPLMRTVAVGVVQQLGEEALPVWQQQTTAARVGQHARAVLAAWGQGPEPTDADWAWLTVEAATAALEDEGPDEALCRIWEGMPGADLDTCLAEVRATGHPDAAELSRGLAEFVASGAPVSLDQVAELKVSLKGFRPPIWRRIHLPVTFTLGDLHQVIQVLFGWDGDHLHLFQAGKKRYSDSFARLEEASDEHAVRVRNVLAPGSHIDYTYDFGAGWEHEIAMVKIVERDPDQAYPICLEFKGDSPVEYWSEEDPEEPEPFNVLKINRKLAALAGTAE